MVHLRDGARLAQESRFPLLIVRAALGAPLDRDRTQQSRILGTPHFAHSPRAEAADQFV